MLVGVVVFRRRVIVRAANRVFVRMIHLHSPWYQKFIEYSSWFTCTYRIVVFAASSRTSFTRSLGGTPDAPYILQVSPKVWLPLTATSISRPLTWTVGLP